MIGTQTYISRVAAGGGKLGGSGAGQGRTGPHLPTGRLRINPRPNKSGLRLTARQPFFCELFNDG